MASCLLSSMVCTAAGLISTAHRVWWVEGGSFVALACLGKAVTPLCCSLGFEHSIFWAERKAGLADEVQDEDAGDAAVFGQHTGDDASKSMPATSRTMLANPFGAAVANLQTIPFCGVSRSRHSKLLAQGAAFPYSRLAPL